MLIKAIKKTYNDWLNAKENELIGGILLSEGLDGQVLLFNKFGICTQNNLSLKSDITNHYTEENYWINDHWAVNPPQYTLSGLIGELIYTPPTGWTKKVEELYGKTGLGLLSVISPAIGSYTASALNIVRKVQSVVDKYTNVVKKAADKLLKRNVIKKTNQRRVLDELESLMNNRQLVSVLTPYGIYERLAIVAVNIRQNENTKFISDVEITFQKWRSIDEGFKNSNEEKRTADIAAAQKAPYQEMGLIGTIKSNMTPEKMYENVGDFNQNIMVA